VRDWPRLLHRRLYYRLLIFLEQRIYTHREIMRAATGVRCFIRASIRRGLSRKGDSVCAASPGRKSALRRIASRCCSWEMTG
jgi:hypothetical protein